VAIERIASSSRREARWGRSMMVYARWQRRDDRCLNFETCSEILGTRMQPTRLPCRSVMSENDTTGAPAGNGLPNLIESFLVASSSLSSPRNRRERTQPIVVNKPFRQYCIDSHLPFRRSPREPTTTSKTTTARSIDHPNGEEEKK
jgi:hypothetical protein